MKKLFVILLTGCLLLSLAACGSTPSATPDPSNPGQPSVPVIEKDQNFSFT